MSQIEVRDLTRTFRVSERSPGLLGSFAGVFSRRYRTVHALDKVSFSIGAGELVGYIGPNGAGKSTTVKILSGILVPDSGECVVSGRIPWKERIEHVRRIGVVFGQRTQLWWDLPVRESFDLLRDIYRLSSAAYRESADELITLLSLEPFLDTPVRLLSLGWRMRCEIAASLLHRPEILFLDEPTIGLDAVAKLAVREFIERINTERGVTVILTTHDMDDIEALCRRVLLIGKGSILCDGTLADLRAIVGGERVIIVDLDEDPGVFSCPGAEVTEINGRRVRMRFDPSVTGAARIIRSITDRYPVRDVFVENPPIDRIIAQIYQARDIG